MKLGLRELDSLFREDIELWEEQDDYKTRTVFTKRKQTKTMVAQ